jgi:hypothetical protein
MTRVKTKPTRTVPQSQTPNGHPTVEVAALEQVP